MVTVREVARVARVSVSTVSHVINDTRRVEPETSDRVRAAIAELGYKPNRLARALRRASSESIGLIISDIENPFFSEVTRGVDSEARESGMSVIIANTDDDPEREHAAIAALRERQVDGLLLAPTSGSGERIIGELTDLDIPVVLVDRTSDVPIDQVGVQNSESMSALVQHLITLGHRDIGLVTGLDGISTSDERHEAFRSTLLAAGLTYRPEHVLGGRSRVEPAREAALAILGGRRRPTALVAGNNLMTLGALEAAQRLGLRVPDDLALVGFDDAVWSEVLSPRLTVIAQPTYEIGRVALQLMLKRLAEPERPTEAVRLPTSLILRESCGRLLADGNAPATERIAVGSPS